MVLIVCMLCKIAAQHPNILPLHRVWYCELILFVIHPFSDAPSLFSKSVHVIHQHCFFLGMSESKQATFILCAVGFQVTNDILLFSRRIEVTQSLLALQIVISGWLLAVVEGP